jgi:hypothetical protein
LPDPWRPHTNWVGFRENLPERLDRLIGEQRMPPVGTVKLTEAGRPSVSRFAEREATDWAGLGQIHGRGDDTDSASLAWRLNLTIPL